MGVLSSAEAKRARASKHATYAWTCPLCDRVFRGNGGRASHQRKHLRDEGIELGPDELRPAWRNFLRARRYECEVQAKCPQDAAYHAESEARQKTGYKAARAIGVDRVPTEYATKIVWRVAVRLLGPAPKESAA